MNKKYFGLIVAAVILGVVAGLAAKPAAEPADVVHYKDPNLTDEEKQVYRERIQKLEQDLATTSNDNEFQKYQLNVQIGLQHFGLGEYAEAQKRYLDATTLVPDNPTAWGELFVVENAMQDYARAKEHLEKALELNPGSQNYWRWLLELEQGPLGASLEHLEQRYQEALRATGDHPDILVLFANFLEREKGDPGAAIEQWRRAKEKNPSSGTVYEAEISRLKDIK